MTLEEVYRRFQEAKLDLKIEIQRLGAELAIAQAERDRAREVLDSCEQVADQRRREIEALTVERDEAKWDLRAEACDLWRLERDKACDRAEAAEAQLAKVTEDFESLMRYVDEAKAELSNRVSGETLPQSIRSLQAQLAKVTEERDRAEAQLARVTKERDELLKARERLKAGG